MRENSKNFWIKNNITSLNIATILLYGIGLVIFQQFNITWAINTIGFWYLVFLTPINIALLFKIKVTGILEWLLVSISIFFTVMTPLYFTANYLFHTPFSFSLLLYFNIFISITSILIIGRPLRNFTIPDLRKITTSLVIIFLKKYWPLLSVIFFYTILHIINYHFYIFIPEWDGYSDLIKIKNADGLNSLETSYRGFFTVAIILISKFSKIPPYNIFSSWLIILQASIIITTFLFVKAYNLKNQWHQFIILLATLSIPVLNMEIDVVRPQTIFVILAPIYLYFLFQALKSNKYSYWLITTIIIVTGLNYHEFFLFLFILHSIVLLTVLYKKYHSSPNHKDRLILYLFLVIIFLLGIILAQHSSFLKYSALVFKDIIHKVSDIQQWRWWFLHDYTGDSSAQQLGWTGIDGAIKYYSYYASPIVIFTLISIIYLATVQKLKKIASFIWPIPFLIILLLSYSELLPRLNYAYLPERIWIIITILSISLIPLITNIVKKKYSKKILTTYLSLIVLLSTIGVSGSVYIAKNKKALTNKSEYQAVLWIKNNTPKNTTLISQPANKPMIEFFAERNFVSASINTFNDGNVLTITTQATDQKIDIDINSIQELLHTTTINNTLDLEKIINILSQAKTNLVKLQEEKDTHKKNFSSEKSSLYILYSTNKFTGLYAEREWWLKANSYNAKIENLTKKYPLIYNKDGVYIWEVIHN